MAVAEIATHFNHTRVDYYELQFHLGLNEK